MIEQLLRDIAAYFDYLHDFHKLFAAFHNASIPLGNHMAALSRYNINSNPYCIYVKSSDTAWTHCIRRQPKVYEKCEEGPFCGTCYAGMGEYVYPILDDGKVLGFVDVSGYCFDRNRSLSRLRRTAEVYGLSEESLRTLFLKNTKPPLLDEGFLKTLISPLCAMFILLNRELSAVYGPAPRPGDTLSNVLSHAVVYLERNYLLPVHAADVAAACHCSTSFISHIFKKNMGMSICDYVNRLRIRDARRLLTDTELSIQRISEIVGYSSSNYMSEVFRALTGMSPRAWRQQKK